MLILPDLPPGVGQSLKSWARGCGPRLVKFGTEVVSSTVPLLAMARPTTSLPLDAWRQDLADFPERELLLSYLEDGFPTLSECAPISIFSRNHGSFMAFKSDSLSHLREEVAAGRILDCGVLPPCWPIRINPLGSVEKRGTTARRRISDMSFPMGASVNDGIRCDALPSLRYASVNDVALLLRKNNAAGGGPMFMAKIDLEGAYRQFPVRSADWWQCGYFVDGRFYLDTRLPFGLSSAPSHFSRITRAVCWRMQRAGFGCIGYLDDFLIVESSRERAEAAVAYLRALLLRWGLPISQRKFEQEGTPATSMIFLGVLVDSVKLELRLDPERIAAIHTELALWVNRQSASVRQIASLVGVLAFAARVIGPGRLYMSRLIAALRVGQSGPLRYDRARSLSSGFRADVQWWLTVMPRWNGVSILAAPAPSVDPRFVIYSDASDWGYGAYCSTSFVYGAWPAEWLRTTPIHVRELAAVVLSVWAFKDNWAGQHVRLSIFSDNDAVVHALSSGRAFDERLNALLRALHVLQAQGHFSFSTQHIAGVRNVGADALSRDNLPLFLSHVAPLNPVQVQCELSTFLDLCLSCQ